MTDVELKEFVATRYTDSSDNQPWLQIPHQRKFFMFLGFTVCSLIVSLIVPLSIPWAGYAKGDWVAMAYFSTGLFSGGVYTGGVLCAIGLFSMGGIAIGGVMSIGIVSIAPFGFGFININCWGIALAGFGLFYLKRLQITIAPAPGYNLVTNDEKIDIPLEAVTVAVIPPFPMKNKPPRLDGLCSVEMDDANAAPDEAMLVDGSIVPMIRADEVTAPGRSKRLAFEKLDEIRDERVLDEENHSNFLRVERELADLRTAKQNLEEEKRSLTAQLAATQSEKNRFFQAGRELQQQYNLQTQELRQSSANCELLQTANTDMTARYNATMEQLSECKNKYETLRQQHELLQQAQSQQVVVAPIDYAQEYRNLEAQHNQALQQQAERLNRHYSDTILAQRQEIDGYINWFKKENPLTSRVLQCLQVIQDVIRDISLGNRDTNELCAVMLQQLEIDLNLIFDLSTAYDLIPVTGSTFVSSPLDIPQFESETQSTRPVARNAIISEITALIKDGDDEDNSRASALIANIDAFIETERESSVKLWKQRYAALSHFAVNCREAGEACAKQLSSQQARNDMLESRLLAQRNMMKLMRKTNFRVVKSYLQFIKNNPSIQLTPMMIDQGDVEVGELDALVASDLHGELKTTVDLIDDMTESGDQDTVAGERAKLLIAIEKVETSLELPLTVGRFEQRLLLFFRNLVEKFEKRIDKLRETLTVDAIRSLSAQGLINVVGDLPTGLQTAMATFKVQTEQHALRKVVDGIKNAIGEPPAHMDGDQLSWITTKVKEITEWKETAENKLKRHVDDKPELITAVVAKLSDFDNMVSAVKDLCENEGVDMGLNTTSGANLIKYIRTVLKLHKERLIGCLKELYNDDDDVRLNPHLLNLQQLDARMVRIVTQTTKHLVELKTNVNMALRTVGDDLGSGTESKPEFRVLEPCTTASSFFKTYIRDYSDWKSKMTSVWQILRKMEKSVSKSSLLVHTLLKGTTGYIASQHIDTSDTSDTPGKTLLEMISKCVDLSSQVKHVLLERKLMIAALKQVQTALGYTETTTATLKETLEAKLNTANMFVSFLEKMSTIMPVDVRTFIKPPDDVKPTETLPPGTLSQNHLQTANALLETKYFWDSILRWKQNTADGLRIWKYDSSANDYYEMSRQMQILMNWCTTRFNELLNLCNGSIHDFYTKEPIFSDKQFQPVRSPDTAAYELEFAPIFKVAICQGKLIQAVTELSAKFYGKKTLIEALNSASSMTRKLIFGDNVVLNVSIPKSNDSPLSGINSMLGVLDQYTPVIRLLDKRGNYLELLVSHLRMSGGTAEDAVKQIGEMLKTLDMYDNSTTRVWKDTHSFLLGFIGVTITSDMTTPATKWQTYYPSLIDAVKKIDDRQKEEKIKQDREETATTAKVPSALKPKPAIQPSTAPNVTAVSDTQKSLPLKDLLAQVQARRTTPNQLLGQRQTV
eukprot:TRINITY_DN4086_c1_g1_i1.p1 TRINITY_DN4086_c1_g1~~TRINITY_DN4086_c1_g1_i1.p1  ORF type:complete len:1446 (-),score=200.15 TRINITY_DN4086_c1_g1_i1:1917-6254(-)